MRPILDTEKKEILRIMREGYFSFRSYNLIRSNLEFIASGHCLNLGREFAYELIHALRNNDRAKKSGGARYQLQMIEGTLKLKENDYLAAADHFKNSLKEYPHIDGAMIQVGMLATAHQYQLALDHIDFIEHNLKSKIKTKMGGLDYESELFRLKEVITEDLNNVK